MQLQTNLVSMQQCTGVHRSQQALEVLKAASVLNLKHYEGRCKSSIVSGRSGAHFLGVGQSGFCIGGCSLCGSQLASHQRQLGRGSFLGGGSFPARRRSFPVAATRLRHL